MSLRSHLLPQIALVSFLFVASFAEGVQLVQGMHTEQCQASCSYIDKSEVFPNHVNYWRGICQFSCVVNISEEYNEYVRNVYFQVYMKHWIQNNPYIQPLLNVIKPLQHDAKQGFADAQFQLAKALLTIERMTGKLTRLEIADKRLEEYFCDIKAKRNMTNGTIPYRCSTKLLNYPFRFHREIRYFSPTPQALKKDLKAKKILHNALISTHSEDISSGVEMWFRSAAQQGHIKAQYALHVIYENGVGIVPKLAEGYAWLSVAFAQNRPFGSHVVADAIKALNPEQLLEAEALGEQYMKQYSNLYENPALVIIH